MSNQHQVQETNANKRQAAPQAQNSKKTKIVEVIDFSADDTINMPLDNNQLFSRDEIQVDDDTQRMMQRKDSEKMLYKLMDNIRNNTGLKNNYIRKQFKLNLIRQE